MGKFDLYFVEVICSGTGRVLWLMSDGGLTREIEKAAKYTSVAAAKGLITRSRKCVSIGDDTLVTILEYPIDLINAKRL